MITDRLLAGGAALIALFVVALYLAVIAGEDAASRDAGRIALVAVSVALAGLGALASLSLPAGLRLPLLTTVATVLAVWGILGLLSIGLPLLVAAALTVGAAFRAAEVAPPGAFRAAIAGPVGVVAFLVAGIALTAS